jgi:hypothetical protein
VRSGNVPARDLNSMAASTAAKQIYSSPLLAATAARLNMRLSERDGEYTSVKFNYSVVVHVLDQNSRYEKPEEPGAARGT